ncbi:Adaptive-response sensory-kinase SasA [Fusobacterium sp. DD29]|uniref:sensor histidine kinase n=1 Tax=unclassified Fusobacterium TaxID=2648384 RepID=UPI001B8BFDEF|nr:MULTISPECIES: HAMP domain-containing sensor histidine kinase [unclassified Fusobacterium]MBR8750469.1 Adaptive-response sensory-kinase SasA [Fusobacterium sp. DD29]MBR8762707.1 Adaptive-response sensory-kinase SasA [Fusobacterium sp. DD25]MBR8772810.1 Adaptive-response sensory-kinase SasA [Fusobacterium sp. DD40]MBR8777019.1 Adaptive-response sensory-kinase SasA [Fusobacterium sp. DD17]MBR8799285.1 Adaptive-response sensory-kinase SasA [Fusobacterium sp. DD12]
MRKKFLSICFLLIFITSLTLGLSFNKMMKNNYIETAFSTALSQANLISIFLSENKKSYLPVFRLVQFFANKSDYRVTFIDEKGTPIADSQDNSIIFTSYADLPVFSGNETTIPVYRIIPSGDKRNKTLEVFATKLTINNKPVILMLSKKLTFFNDFQKKIAGTILFSIIFSGILSIILSIIVVDRAIKPILLLTKAVKNITLGKYNTALSITTHDEIRELGNNFIYMQNKINTLVQAIEDKANNLQLILNNLQTTIFVISKDGKLVLFNNYAIKEFNINKQYTTIYDYPQLKFLTEGLNQIIESKKIINMKKNTNNKTYRIKLNYIEDNTDQVIITAQDITKIETTERMRREFVSNASHELKTPITIISGFIETIKLGHIKDSNQLNHFIDIIEQEVKRLSLLTNSLLELSNSENSGNSKKQIYTIKIDECFANIISLYEKLAKDKQIDILSEIENIEITSYINYEFLRTVVGNLIDNAIKYSNNNTNIFVKANLNNNKIIIKVQDQGIGISKADLQNIFRRFYRVDKSRNSKTGGTGLGLAIVKNMIFNLNGKIKVDSKLGEGTIFTVTIPLNI